MTIVKPDHRHLTILFSIAQEEIITKYFGK